MRRGARAPFVRKAEDLSFRRDLYTLSDPESAQDPFFIDKLWQSIEGGLPNALDALTHSDRLRLPSELWVTRLLPFFAGLFVRHPQWEAEFEKRLDAIMGNPDWRDWVHRDNSKQARLIELTSLAATLMSASWNVLHFPTSVPAIVTDRGYVGHRNPQLQSHDIGYAFSIDRSTVLTVFYEPNQRRRPRIRWRTDRSVARIRHYVLRATDARNFNIASAVYAESEIYGPSPELVREAARGWSEPAPLLMPPALLADGRDELRKMQETFVTAHSRLTEPGRPWPVVFLRGRTFLRHR